ncbi:ParA family protein [Bartonella sp. 1-1C]|uniref:ParA family protein n=1 Tax=Bartonella sp. 1-1C TaxID=515256 RepID=UPI0001F4CC67|nr:ParA family protein [Bartonella sp. 1-1C]ATO56939.1 chromosome partitioning protein [Bartonella sp. 1-1C]CBI80372.1 ATPase involved in chromosome partitioning-like protein [Bartonella sp. 1-1C]
MPTIVFCSTKGGVGKSTSALILAQVLAQHGSKVKIIDTDPNQPIADEWWQNARTHYPLNIDVQGGINENTILDVIDEAANTHSFVIVDLEGSANITASYAISRSDMVIIPMSGTKLDSREAAKVVSFIAREGRARRSNIPYRILFSKSSVIQTREEKEIRKELAEAKLPVLEHGMMNKAAFSSIFSFGCTLYQLNKEDVSNTASAIENAEQVAADIVEALKLEGIMS